ncbi:hypothetical protein BC833DRAFT_598572, partial [Globomyces pollinis-pini]
MQLSVTSTFDNPNCLNPPITIQLDNTTTIQVENTISKKKCGLSPLLNHICCLQNIHNSTITYQNIDLPKLSLNNLYCKLLINNTTNYILANNNCLLNYYTCNKNYISIYNNSNCIGNYTTLQLNTNLLYYKDLTISLVYINNANTIHNWYTNNNIQNFDSIWSIWSTINYFIALILLSTTCCLYLFTWYQRRTIILLGFLISSITWFIWLVSEILLSQTSYFNLSYQWINETLALLLSIATLSNIINDYFILSKFFPMLSWFYSTLFILIHLTFAGSLYFNYYLYQNDTITIWYTIGFPLYILFIHLLDLFPFIYMLKLIINLSKLKTNYWKSFLIIKQKTPFLTWLMYFTFINNFIYILIIIIRNFTFIPTSDHIAQSLSGIIALTYATHVLLSYLYIHTLRQLTKKLSRSRKPIFIPKQTLSILSEMSIIPKIPNTPP